MKLFKGILLLLAVGGLLFCACAEEDNPYPSEPATATAITGSNGQAVLDFGSHVITVTAVDFIPQPIEGITINGYLFKEYLYLFAVGDESWYSNHKLVPYSEMESSQGTIYAAKPSSPETIEDYIEITLESITREVYSYTEDPQYQDELFVDDWATVITAQGTLADVYDIANTIAINRNVILAIGNEVALDANASVQTIAMVIDSNTVENDTVFSVLIGLEFHLFDADTLTYSYIEYGEEVIPFIMISNATLVEGSFFCQFTLTWGEAPNDLDSHLWTPDIEGSLYHVYYANPGAITEAPYAFLDVDDVTSWGPEHIVIQQEFPGTYYYSVYHFAGDSNIPASGTVVSLLKPDRSVQEFTPPNQLDTGQGWYWHVCTIDGTTGEIIEDGTMTEAPPTTAAMSYPMPSKEY